MIPLGKAHVCFRSEGTVQGSGEFTASIEDNKTVLRRRCFDEVVFNL